jgi:hypothetical protein
MSRSGYSDDLDYSRLNLWRGAVASALRGKRGQAFLRELIAALDAMPEKKLISSLLKDENGCVCALGAVGQARGLALPEYDPDDYIADTMGSKFGIAHAMAGEIMFENDEGFWGTETPEQRWTRMRRWAESNIIEAKP